MNGNFRHEYKFTLSLGDYMGLRSRLRAALPHDPHAGPSGEYFIRSVYFDNVDDKALREKLDGVDHREKFRIRWYNRDISFLQLEKKSKERGLCRKTGCAIAWEEAERIFQGETSWMRADRRKTVRELFAKMVDQQLRPKAIVDYTREPFVFPGGNVRITLDRNIRRGSVQPDMLTREPVTRPAGDDVILEVKYDAFLPDFIRDLVGTGKSQAGAFSKYAVCRGYR